MPRREKEAIDPKAPAACLQEYRGFVASLKQNREVKLTHTHKPDTNEKKKKKKKPAELLSNP